MTKFIEARLIQKIGTEAEWNNISLPLYQGEIALVRSGDRVVNMKVGDGESRFSELNYIYSGGFNGSINPTTVVTDLTKGFYFAEISGVYNNIGGVVVKEGYYTIFEKNNMGWTKSTEVKMPMQDLTQINSEITSLKNKNGGQVSISETRNVDGGQVFNFVNNSSINKWNLPLFPDGYYKNMLVVVDDAIWESLADNNTDKPSYSSNKWKKVDISDDVDQTYNPNSSLAQSGKAVNEAVEKSAIPDDWFEYSQSGELIPFTLFSGQIAMNGSVAPSNNWIRAEIINFKAGEELVINGLGNFDFSPKAPPYIRVAFYNSSNALISKIDWVDGVNSLTVTPPLACVKIGLQVDGGTGVGSSPSTSPFLNSLKITTSVVVEEKIGIKADKVIGNSLSSSVICYVNSNVSSSGNGGVNSPFKTINEAISYISSSGGTIVVSEGIYREVLNFATLKNGDFKIISKIPNTVKIYGSQKLENWTLSSGQSKTYQTPFIGTIPKGLNNRFDQMIFEDGNPSMPILPNQIHPLQKSLFHRLPFTALIKKTTIADVEANAGSFAHISGVLYVHPSNSTNPNTNGFGYEVIQRDLNTVKNAVNNDLTNIYLENLQFMFGKTALRFIGFNYVNRKNVSVLANLDAGAIRDDTCNVYSINDEAGFCDSDGINGHFLSYPNYDKLTNNRSMSPVAIYVNPWCHDNLDDGLSHHENHRVTVFGGLFEYNGDGGVRASNDANYDIYNAHARYNGFRTDRSIGEGFGVVNPILNTSRNNCKLNLYNCITEYNRTGIGSMGSGNVINAYSCISRNNIDGELYAHSSSIINSYNTLGYNTNSLKLKVIVSNGVINIFNSELIT